MLILYVILSICADVFSCMLGICSPSSACRWTITRCSKPTLAQDIWKEHARAQQLV